MTVFDLVNAIAGGDGALACQYSDQQDEKLSNELTALFQTGLATEQQAREAQDVVLQGNIDSEAQTRATQDTQLQTNITSEEQSRTTQDANLQSQVTVNTNKLTTLLDVDSTMDQISEIVTAYGAADSSLQTSLTNLINLRPLTTYVDAQDNTLESNINTEKGRIDAIVANTTVDTFEEVKTVTDALSSSITTNAGDVSTNASGISTNLTTNNTQGGLITANATAISGNTASISSNDSDILSIQNKTAAVTQAEIASLAGIGSTTVASQLAEKSARDTPEVWQANKTIKVDGNLAFRVRNASGDTLFTCDTTDMEVQTPSLAIDSDGLNLASGKTIKFDDTLLAMSNLSDAGSYSTTSVINSARTTALGDYSTTSVIAADFVSDRARLTTIELAEASSSSGNTAGVYVKYNSEGKIEKANTVSDISLHSFPAGNITGTIPDGNIASASTWNAKQGALSNAQIAVCNGDVFPASSYSTTSVTNSARATALGDYTTTSALTGQLNAKQDDLSVAQLAVCNGDVFTVGSYSTTSVTNSARATALADYSTTSTLTGQLNAKQDDLSVAQLAVCNGDAFTSSSYSTTSATNTARTNALADYTTTSTLTGQLNAKQDSLNNANQIYIDTSNSKVGIGMAPVSEKFNVKGGTKFYNSAGSVSLQILEGKRIECANGVPDALDLRTHGTGGGVTFTNYDGGTVSNVARFQKNEIKFYKSVRLEGNEVETSSYTIRLTNLPTSEGAASANGLWRDSSGYLRIKDA